jgi:hypothetical protein
VLPAEAIFAHKLRTLESAMSRDKPVDPKHLSDAICLGRLLDRTPPKVHEHLLKRDVYSTDVNLRCFKCERSANPLFAPAPKQQILTLGYV